MMLRNRGSLLYPGFCQDSLLSSTASAVLLDTTATTAHLHQSRALQDRSSPRRELPHYPTASPVPLVLSATLRVQWSIPTGKTTPLSEASSTLFSSTC